MKTPLWELSPGHLVQWLLNHTEAKPIDLWTITLQDGTVLRYSGADVAVTVNGNTWELGPKFKRDRTSQRMGVSVDTMAVTVVATDANTVNGVPILRLIAQGGFSRARVGVAWCFLDAQNVAQGVVGGFSGRVGDVPGGSRHLVKFNVRSFTSLLDVMVPGDVYQPGCKNRLFDGRCGLSEAAFTVAGTVASATPDRRQITSTSAAVIAKPSTWAALGTLRFTSGDNAGQTRPVRLHTLSGGTATVQVMYPFLLPIGAGDTFQLVAGCDKTLAMCESSKFSNKPRFRGEKFVPPPESIA